MSILIVDYDPSWPAQFESEALRIREALGELALRIEHVGSTAVPGLAAKPLLDIQISIADVRDLTRCRVALEAIGYTHTTEPFPFFHRPAGWPHSHHVHVREAGSADEVRTLAFRDWLRSHERDRRAYESLKRELADGADATTVEGRFRYSEAKTAFIRDIERRSRGRES